MKIACFGYEARLANCLGHQPVLLRVSLIFALLHKSHDWRFCFLPRFPIVMGNASAIAYCPAIIRADKDHPLKIDSLETRWCLHRLPVLAIVVEKGAPGAHGPPFLRGGKRYREQVSVCGRGIDWFPLPAAIMEDSPALTYRPAFLCRGENGTEEGVVQRRSHHRFPARGLRFLRLPGAAAQQAQDGEQHTDSLDLHGLYSLSHVPGLA